MSAARHFALQAALLLAAACNGNKAPLHPPTGTPQNVVLQVAGRPVHVELALDDAAREHGLMHRTALADDAGMLFIFPDEQVRTFWMKNTLIPLDITFLTTNGTLINVGHGTPGVEVPGVWSDAPARMVLELRAGWSADHGFKPGDRVEVPQELLDLAR
ncbi:MAG TPA: DUF192 domain-containing protein [Planctomycetota bacterium]|nr:DUF192 domain-containing protein [Planctomycetota bacterium]